MIKDWNTPLGAKKHCPNFDPCPLCFGCRNYSSAVKRCQECYEDNKKQNICNRELHTETALSMMLKLKNKTYVQGE